MNIGQFVCQVGVFIDIVCYYEWQYLLLIVCCSVGGYWVFSEDDLMWLQFICCVKVLGFSLEEIGELLLFSDQYGQDMVQVCSIVVQKLQDI